MFNRTLGNYTGTKYKVELLEGSQPYYAKPFPIAKVHEETLKTEVNTNAKIILNGQRLYTVEYCISMIIDSHQLLFANNVCI